MQQQAQRLLAIRRQCLKLRPGLTSVSCTSIPHIPPISAAPLLAARTLLLYFFLLCLTVPLFFLCSSVTAAPPFLASLL